MDLTTQYVPDQQGVGKLLEEAQYRWLETTEICEIIENHQRLQLSIDPPVKPPDGSLFLFDRNLTRNFRKDGHEWRKTKDGKRFEESYEKLKVENIEVLNSWYTHGADNNNFIRRCYSMIDERFKHIVLVHYLQFEKIVTHSLSVVDEESSSSSSRALALIPSPLIPSPSASMGLRDINNSSLWTHSNIILNKNYFLRNPQTSHFLFNKSIYPGMFIDMGLAKSNLVIEYNVDSSETSQSNEAVENYDGFEKWLENESGGGSNYGNTASTSTSTSDPDPFLFQVQLFRIQDIVPAWAYSGVQTKVLITGSFLIEESLYKNHKWWCMFGVTEVPAQILTDSLLWCVAPIDVPPGHVPFTITRGNRLSCSNIRTFEYRESPTNVAPNEETSLLIRFSDMLSADLDKKWLGCSIVNCDNCKLKTALHSLKGDGELIGFDQDKEVRDFIMEKTLKDKLYEWIVCKTHEGGKGLRILDYEGQGVIHLAAALGYDWVMCPLVSSGLSINFRDVLGRSALHWAAFYGKEEVIAALVKLGATSGALDDSRQTPSDLASSKGYIGIAGYISEADLTNSLQLLTPSKGVMDIIVATALSEKTCETSSSKVVAPLDMSIEEDIMLKGCLSAVRRSAYAAYLIGAALKDRSFNYKQKEKSSTNHSFQDNITKMNHYEDYLLILPPPLNIQPKKQTCKGRKDIIKIRNRILKTQAHVREHEQVCKSYEKIVWAVGILEKAILRWRMRKHGLRGFYSIKTKKEMEKEKEKEKAKGKGKAKEKEKETESETETDEEKDEYDFLHIGTMQKLEDVEKALASVQSMVRNSEARDQYMRLVSIFERFKVNTY